MTEHDELLLSCDDYYFTAFGHQRDIPYTYDKDDWVIGLDEDKCEVNLDVSEAFRACFIAATRTGKTFIIRRVMDEAYHSGWTVAVLPDAKDEYKSSMGAVQKEFQKNLPLGEKPKGLKMRIFRPRFFRDIDDGQLPSKNEWAALELKDLTKTDLQTLINYTVLTPKQQLDFDDLWERMQETDTSTFEEIQTLCAECGYTKVWEKIRFINTCNLFDSRFRIDPVEVLKSKTVLVLNYEGFDKLDLKDNSLDQVFMSVWIRWIKDAKKNNEFSNLLIINDETARWVPRNGEPSCKKQILESIDVDAGFGVSWIFGFQRAESVPEGLVRQCKYKFIPYNADRNTLEGYLKGENIIQNMVVDQKQYREYITTLKAKKFRWMKLTKGDQDVEFLDPYSPVSAHMKTRRFF